MADAKTARLVTNLEATLRQLLDLHTELLELLVRKRELVRSNDTQAMTKVSVLEHEKLQKIAELEKQRLNTVAELTLKYDPNAKAPLKMADLAEQLSEPMRGKLLVLRQQLLERMREVQQQTHVVHRATEALSKHMHGIVQTLGALSAGIATYGRGGSLPQQNTAVSTFSATA